MLGVRSRWSAYPAGHHRVTVVRTEPSYAAVGGTGAGRQTHRALRRRVVALEDGRIIRDDTGATYHRED